MYRQSMAQSMPARAGDGNSDEALLAVGSAPQELTQMQSFAQKIRECHQLAMLPELQNEILIFSKLMYKNHNQHRKMVHYHKLSKVYSDYSALFSLIASELCCRCRGNSKS